MHRMWLDEADFQYGRYGSFRPRHLRLMLGSVEPRENLALLTTSP